jgi:murein DD-endopeptidase MepM/ murein hydrolase activator NlpD
MANRQSGSHTVALSVALSLVLAFAAFGAASARSRDQTVYVRKVASRDYVTLVVENHKAHDVTATLTIQANNVDLTWLKPETETYSGHSQTQAVRIVPTDPAKRWDYRYHFDWIKGSLHAEHDAEVLYHLPYESGTSHRVTQGHHGKLTHQGQEQYALDFAMTEGTPVYAARDGIVVDVKESSKAGGPRKSYKDLSNYVSIAHADGTIGEYHHLQHNSVLVEIGRRIKVGTVIALSGNTGYSTRPHLHFGVYSAVDATQLQSHPVIFTTRRGIVAELVQGRSYTAK